MEKYKPIKAKKGVDVPDGEYEGTIKELKQTSGYNKEGEECFYLNVILGADKIEEFNPKYSCPENITQNSKLGQLLVTFGCPIEDIKNELEISPEDYLKPGTKVKFVMKKGDTFSEVVKGSLKPA